MLEVVSAPALRLTWDPANVVYGGFDEPLSEGYPLVQPYVANVHVKDAVFEEGNGHWVSLGAGAINWPTQIHLLSAAGYDGCFTAEPHLQYESPMQLVQKMETFLKQMRALSN